MVADHENGTLGKELTPLAVPIAILLSPIRNAPAVPLTISDAPLPSIGPTRAPTAVSSTRTPTTVSPAGLPPLLLLGLVGGTYALGTTGAFPVRGRVSILDSFNSAYSVDGHFC